ncbi:MAG: YkgJ family cysteine cluster protein [Actinobacteria bacterium]|nr:YkgJ family cysteine cluster protein [Actinomycetota bacterium]
MDKKSDCQVCRGQCCRYFGLPIETPETPGDFDDVRWYLLHMGTEVYVEDGDWYLNVRNKCKHLQPDSSCGIYSRRPRICSKYSMNECEAISDEYGHEHHFYNAEQLEAYARGYLRAKRRQAQLKAARRKARQPQISRTA